MCIYLVGGVDMQQERLDWDVLFALSANMNDDRFHLAFYQFDVEMAVENIFIDPNFFGFYLTIRIVIYLFAESVITNINKSVKLIDIAY